MYTMRTLLKSGATGLPCRQSGAVLVVGLIMLLLMTIVGLAAVRGSGLQEMMAGNTRDRSLAFQAAEAGLRVAEDVDTEALAFNGANGAYMDLNQPGATPAAPSRWTSTDWANFGEASGLDFSPYVPNSPRYVIERVVMPIGAVARAEGSGLSVSGSGGGSYVPEPEYFRVTSRSTGGTENVEVILQTMVKRLPETN